jgi:hypothetical protein
MREEIKRAVDIACRAEGFSEQLHEQGFIRRGDVVHSVVKSILSLETEQYPAFVIHSILETAEVLKRMLDKANFDSGKRRYYPLMDTGRGHHEQNH